MDISPTAYRILKFLKVKKSHSLIPHDIIPISVCETTDIKEEISFELKSLVGKGLIEETKSDVSITPAGIDYLGKIEHQNEDLAYENVYDDYEYSILKYLYVNNWGISLDDFPNIMMKEVPEKTYGVEEGNLLEYLESQKQYIDKDLQNHRYKLNNFGKRRYRYLTDKKIAEKEAKSESPRTVYQIEKVEQHGTNMFGSSNTNTHTTTNSNNTTSIIEQKPSDKKWSRVIGEAIMKAIVNYYIPVLIGFAIGLFAGKSCNQTPLQNQIQNSIDSAQTLK